MSYSGAVPLDPDHSDSAILIEACLARVRRQAGLDAEPVLPPLDVLLRDSAKERPFPSGLRPDRVPSPLAVLHRRAPALVLSTPADVPSSSQNPARSDATTAKRPRSVVRRLAWPVVFCGFVGGAFGGAALMKSPFGQLPAVQHAARSTQQYVERAYSTAQVAVKARLQR
jgi:hypothetical protein